MGQRKVTDDKQQRSEETLDTLDTQALADLQAEDPRLAALLAKATTEAARRLSPKNG